MMIDTRSRRLLAVDHTNQILRVRSLSTSKKKDKCNKSRK